MRKIRGLPLSKFVRSPAALIGGVEVTRSDVIRYVANKLGGAHFDPTRSRSGDDRLSLLDVPITTVEIEGAPVLSNVYAEMLSITQFLAQSGDAARFRDAFRRVEVPA